MLNKALSKLAVKVGLKLLGNKIREAAEGKLGPKWKKLYWTLAGKKTIIGAVVGLGAVALAQLGYEDIGTGVLGAGFLLLQWGLMDKAWRAEVSETLQGKGWYRFLVTHASDWGAILLIILGVLSQQPESEAITWAMKGIGALAAVMVQLGILEPGWKATPPRSA